MIKYFKEQLNLLFNWKKYPKNIFLIAIPLFALGISCEIMVAYLHWKINGDIAYAYILLAGMAVLGICLWPIRKFVYKEFIGG